MEERERMVLVPKGVTILWDRRGISLLKKPYLIDREATTQGEYLHYLMDTDQTLDPDKWDVRGMFSKTVRPRAGKLDDPVVGVSWEEAAKYARWRDARLPTSLEWLKAVRGKGPNGWPPAVETVLYALAEKFARSVVALYRSKDRSDEQYDAIFAEVVAPVDTGDKLNPAITPGQVGEWTSEPLGAAYQTWESYYAAIERDINRQADLERARLQGRIQDVPLIHAYYHRLGEQWKQNPLHTAFSKWEESGDDHFMHFDSDILRHERSSENYLKKTWRANLIGFRCARDA